jgi:hypothetical protein
MIRMIALALALGVGAAPAYAEGGEDHKATRTQLARIA